MRTKPSSIIAVCACVERRLVGHDAVTSLVDQLPAEEAALLVESGITLASRSAIPNWRSA